MGHHFTAPALLFASLAAAENAPPLMLSRSRGPIAVDGDLSDSGWQGAARMDTFYETQPGDNVEPKVRTTVFVTYDTKALYIAVRCEDPEPGKIRAPFVDRDNVIGTDDNVAIFLDTRNDRRSAVELRVSPRGIQGDAVFNDANGNEDFAPDFFYDTAAKIADFGWSAEFRVPFSSLRYPKTDPQTWGILVWRNYPRDFRYFIHSNRLPRNSNCLVCHCTPMTGLSGLPDAGNWVVAPYASGQSVAAAPALGERLGPADENGDVGLDVKWTPSAETAIDATLNPDFSQIEADVAQIAVNNRFALFFPEKRPFFLEGVDLFDTPIQALYTRTITSPLWGARGTGKLGATSYTLLVAQDRGGGSVILPGPQGSDLVPQDFGSVTTIGRVRRDLGSSFVGLLVTDREIEDGGGGGHNRVIGPDFQWRPTQSDQVTGQILFSDSRTPRRPDLAAAWDGRSLTGHAAALDWGHTTRVVDWFVRYRDFGDDFRADAGFVPQVGYREGNAQLGYNFWPKGLLRRVRGYVVTNYAQDRQGGLLTRSLLAGTFFTGRKNLTGVLEVTDDRLRTGAVVVGRTQVWGFVQIDPSRRVARLSAHALLGEEIDLAHARVGQGGQFQVSGMLRPTVHLTLEPLLRRRWLDVTPPGRGEGRLFTAHVYRLKTVYNFSARGFLRLIGQYVTTDRDPSLYAFPVPGKSGSFEASALISYKLNWQTALYFGYGDNRALDAAGDLQRSDRQLFVKASYAIQR